MGSGTTAISFAGKAFCFTGGMADLKRTAAEREVRARGGLTTDRVNDRLDYLVVGDVPSAGWKHGSYGRKIETARALTGSHGCRLCLVREGDFVEALAMCAPENDGAIDVKVVVCNYKFVVADAPESYDDTALEVALADIQATEGCHVSVPSHWANMLADLYGGDPAGDSGSLVVECRFVRQQSLAQPGAVLADAVARRLEGVRGVDGRIRWFEQQEGSASYIRLLAEVPSNLRVPGL